ncbi:MAG: glycosyltransferase family 2 protein [Lachnospira sp.]|nr:glycosyltransferase family 2 protein [Lachnospira sp.]
MKAVLTVNTILYILLVVLYFYQFVYIIVALINDKKKKSSSAYQAKKLHRFAFIIAARNESAVIGNLIKSIKAQNYPSELIDVIVVADNCTDNTAEIARSNGAIVYERFNDILKGKSYALDYAFNNICEEHGSYTAYDGYFIFDADNIIDRNYVREMNNTFDQGYKVITSYRNSKNFGTNWITSGYSLWFCREAKFLNNPRMILKTSCAVSGTGFLINSHIIQKYSGWKFNLLTEDIEFSVVNILDGEKIGYCADAMFYDEQPETFSQSWNQRLRWSKGFYQVMFKYGHELIGMMFKRRELFVSCYDMFMTIAPATLLSVGCVLLNLVFLLVGLTDMEFFKLIFPLAMESIVFGLINYYLLMFMMGIITMITESSKIIATKKQKFISLFTFPLFMATYIPISLVALVKKVEWKPITHCISTSMEDIEIQQQYKQ